MLERRAKKEARKTAKTPKPDGEKEFDQAKDGVKEDGEKKEGDAKQTSEKKRTGGKRPPHRNAGRNSQRPKRTTRSEGHQGSGNSSKERPAAQAEPNKEKEREDKTGLTTEYKRPSADKRLEVTPPPVRPL